MKIAGVIILLIGVGLEGIWLNDPSVGRVLIPTGILFATLGFCLFLEGLELEIIAAIQKKNSQEGPDKKEQNRT